MSQASCTDTATSVPPSPEEALEHAFRRAFRHQPAGVAILTARVAGEPVGVTASSVTSVSVDPPALSYVLNDSSSSGRALLSASSVLVHLLDHRHSELAGVFAGWGAAKFASGQAWDLTNQPEPWLRDATALRCQPVRILVSGSSSLVLAHVVDVLATERRSPVAFLNGSFHGLSRSEGT